MRRKTIIVLILALASVSPALALSPEAIYLRGLTLDSNETIPDAWLERGAGDELRLIHFDRPVGRREHETLVGMGAEILGYLPVNGFLLRAPADRLNALAALPGVDLFLDYRPEWRLAPELRAAAGQGDEILDFTLSFAAGTPLGLRGEQAVVLGAERIKLGRNTKQPRLWLRASTLLLPELSKLSDLLWIEAVRPIVERNNDSSWILQSGVLGARPIWDRGLQGEGQIIGHIDSGFDRLHCFFADPDGEPIGPDHRKIIFVGEAQGSYSDHGTHTAGTAVGFAGPAFPEMEDELRGGAFLAKIAHSSYQQDGYDLLADFELHHQVGARIHTNSWGQDYVTDYTQHCVDIDTFAHQNEENLIVWSITNQTTLYTPENAKNTLAVGASWTNDTIGDNLRNFHMWYSGGIGPTADDRHKPELYGPGYGIRSADAWESFCNNRTMSGTSMASPGIAGAAALARQYFTEGWWPSGAADAADALTPSGALLKALLLNSTLPMDSLPDGYPNFLEGWGHLVLEEALYFAGDSRELWLTDVRNADGLETGEEYYYQFQVESAAEPLAITMAFTDPPGLVLTDYPVVNNLDLALFGPSGEFLGNVFDEELGVSTSGGETDPINNVERMILAAPIPGEYMIRVRAASVPLGPQGYGLAVNGDLGEAVIEIAPDPAFLLFEQNFPNPFVAGEGTRGGTTLRFELRASQRGSLRIYDVAGRRVRSLINNEQLAFGVTERIWDGLDDAGEKAASGIYFARLEMDQRAEIPVVRIVLLR